jgi:hypothetical protein
MSNLTRGMRARGRSDGPARLLLLGASASPSQPAPVPCARSVWIGRSRNADLTRSVVTTGELSWATPVVLQERGLYETFDDRPEVAIAELHRAMVDAQGNDRLLHALAETSFLHGQAARKPTYQMAAAIYAYAFLFPERSVLLRAVRSPLPERGGPVQLVAHRGVRLELRNSKPPQISENWMITLTSSGFLSSACVKFSGVARRVIRRLNHVRSAWTRAWAALYQ